MTDETTAPAAGRPTIAEAIAERMTEVGPRTREKVVEHFAEKLADKQANALIAGLDKLSSMENDLRKIKPDNVLFNEEGVEVSSGYSKGKLDERNKLIEQIGKLRKALDKADDKGDFGDLYNLTK